MGMFRVTYEIVSYELAEHGDLEENGFVLPGGWQVPIETAMEDKEGDYTMTLRAALDLVGCCEDVGSWFSETDGRTNYATGDNERRALHPPRNVTAASYARLRRLLKAY